MEHEGSVLEGTTELSGIHGHLYWETSLVQDGVFSNRGSTSVHGPINKSLVNSVAVRSSISSGDVVSHSQHAVAIVASDARFPASSWHGDVVAVGKTRGGLTVTQMVVSAPRRPYAIRRRNVPWGSCLPDVSGVGRFAGNGVVWQDWLARGIRAPVLRFNVLGFRLVKAAIGFVCRKDDEISPRSWVPVRIVVSLF